MKPNPLPAFRFIPVLAAVVLLGPATSRAQPELGALTVDPPLVEPGSVVTLTLQTSGATRAAALLDFRPAATVRQRVVLSLDADGLGTGTFTVPATAQVTDASVIAINCVALDEEGTRVTARRVLSLVGNLPPEVSFTSPEALTRLSASPATVAGLASADTQAVEVNGVPALLTGTTWSATVPVREGTTLLTAVATDAEGAKGTASRQVRLDTTPPSVVVTTPADGAETTAAQITITGIINDIVVGTVNNDKATVMVNGLAATVSNRCFLADAIPLELGDNTITVVGTDVSGNSANTTITVRRVNPGQKRVVLVSGNPQTGGVGQALPDPLVAKAIDASGQPVAGVPLVFRIQANNGSLVGDNAQPSRVVVATTGANGEASVTWRLGFRSGAGNNVVEATATGYRGSAIFSAVADFGNPAKVNVDSGTPQCGVIARPLPEPFLAVVTDLGHNRLAGVPVTFRVEAGGGHFGAPGTREMIVVTDSDGRAAVTLTLGPEEGISNNRVSANYPGNPPLKAAVFDATGKAPRDPAQTCIKGVVLDNTDRPIRGVTMTVKGTPLLTTTDAEGQFLIKPAPVGHHELIADGSTALRPGKWPKLEFMINTIAGQENDLGMPVYLVQLRPENAIQVSETKGGSLTLDRYPGFALDVKPGSVTFPDNSRQGDVSVTVVHNDKVPMAPNFGQQPRFVITIQPPGAHFSPPAKLTLPNVDGLSPGEITEMYSFDHDLMAFVAIGTGTVSNDGTVIVSDRGLGVIKAGWHCGGNPQSVAAGMTSTVEITTDNGEGPLVKCWQDPMIVSNADNTLQITAKGDPTPAHDPPYEWKSSDPSCVAIKSGGDTATVTVECLKPGRAKVSVVYQCKSAQKSAPDEIEVICKKVDLIAHQMAKFGSAGSKVDEKDEEMPEKWELCTNEDHDEMRKFPAPDDDTLHPDKDDGKIGTDDDEVSQLKLKLIPDDLDEGTVTLSVPSGVHVFNAAGNRLTVADLTVDLASPSGPLSGLATSGEQTLYVEGTSPSADAKFTLTCMAHGKTCKDEVHAMIQDIDFIIMHAKAADETESSLANEEEEGSGIFLCENDDDDDENMMADDSDDLITGTATQKGKDKEDMATLRLEQLASDRISGGKVFLRKKSGDANIRVFKKSDDSFLFSTASSAAISDSQATDLFDALKTADQFFLVEAVEPGEMELEMEYLRDGRKCRDILKITVLDVDFVITDVDPKEHLKPGVLIALNDDFDEENASAARELIPDNQADTSEGHRIKADDMHKNVNGGTANTTLSTFLDDDDNELADAKIVVRGPVGTKGKWKFKQKKLTAGPGVLKTWGYDEMMSEWEEVMANTQSDELMLKAPVGGGSPGVLEIPVKLEGIARTANANEIEYTPLFTPLRDNSTESPSMCGDIIKLSIIDVEVEVNQTDRMDDDYVTWAPTMAQARVRGMKGYDTDLKVLLQNDPIVDTMLPSGTYTKAGSLGWIDLVADKKYAKGTDIRLFGAPADGAIGVESLLTPPASPRDPARVMGGRIRFAYEPVAWPAATTAALAQLALDGSNPLGVALPKDESFVKFRIAGQFMRPSFTDRDVIIDIHQDDASGRVFGNHRLMVRVRKNSQSLFTYERDVFLEAVAAMNAAGTYMSPHQDSHGNAAEAGDEGHCADQAQPAFAPWHRAMILQFERAMQTQGPARFRAATLPYWNWDAASPKLFHERFIGGSHGGGASSVAEPVFHATNPLRGFATGSALGGGRIARNGRDQKVAPGGFRSLAGLLGQANYGPSSRFGDGTAPDSFSLWLERDAHNSGHTWPCDSGHLVVGAETARDPLFYLLHSQTDRLWAAWQRRHVRFGAAATTDYDNDTTFDPALAAPVGLDVTNSTGVADRSATASLQKGSHLNDEMWPWDGSSGPNADPRQSRPTGGPPGNFLPSSIDNLAPSGVRAPSFPTPRDMIDYLGRANPADGLGYCYDDVAY